MKTIKRIGTTIMAVIMVLVMGTSVMAANTVSGGSGGNTLVIHKYMSDSAVDWTNVKRDGTDQSASIPTGAVPVSGITFTVKSAVLIDPQDVGSTDPADYTLTTVISGATASDGVLEITGLADGLYYVEETASAASTDVTNFFVNLPMTNPAGSGLMSTVHAYPKNDLTDATINKKVLDENDDPVLSTQADVGDDVTWRITAVVPGEFANADTSAGSADYYTITDVLDKSLDYKSAVVKLAGTALTAGTDYTLTPTNNADGTTTVVISFTKAQLAKLVSALAGTNATITVDLTTTINENAYDGMLAATGDYVIPNQASYEWKVGSKNGGDETPDPDPEDPDVPVVTVTGLLIYKTDNSTPAKPLPGAKFVVTDGNTGTPDETVEKTTDAKGYVYWGSEELEDTFGTKLGIFYALETAAPSGYAIITGYTAFAELTSVNKSAVITLRNYPSNFELPTTGGIGTLLFTVGGLVLIGTACVLILVSKRKKRERM